MAAPVQAWSPSLNGGGDWPNDPPDAEIRQDIHDAVDGRADHHLREIAFGQIDVADGLVLLLVQPLEVGRVRNLARLDGWS